MSQVVSIFKGKQLNLDDIERGLDCNNESWFKCAM